VSLIFLANKLASLLLAKKLAKHRNRSDRYEWDYSQMDDRWLSLRNIKLCWSSQNRLISSHRVQKKLLMCSAAKTVLALACKQSLFTLP
jgi:hypothetical protein